MCKSKWIGAEIVTMGNCCSSRQRRWRPIPAEFTEFRGAGMIFDNGHTILCGLERKDHGHPAAAALYGIGGKREPRDANHRETAAREVIEELLGIQHPTPTLLHRLLNAAPPPYDETIVHGYVMMRYLIKDLEMMLVALAGQSSPYYTRMPRSVSELVLKRRAPPNAEMTHLCLLPMVSPAPTVSADLAGDIVRLLVYDRCGNFDDIV